MSVNTINTLEFNVILAGLAGHAYSNSAKDKLRELKPFMSESLCKAKMRETTEARSVLESIGSPPLAAMSELEETIELSSKGAMLIPAQFSCVLGFIASCRRMKSYLKRARTLDVQIAFYGDSFSELELLYAEIDRSIRNESVDDSASAALRDIRRKMESVKSSVKEKLESMLRGKKEWFAESYVATRNGRLVLPVKKEFKNQIKGTVVDISGTGGTCFVEPESVRRLQENLAALQIEEDNEVRKILYILTALVDEHSDELRINMDSMEKLDFAFAKAKLSLEMKAVPVPVNTDRRINIKQGRHPLLNQDACVPLDFEIGGGVSGVVITGPNTGGKTVALKTVGLLSMMAQSGLHVPVSHGSEFCMHNDILCDIGDGQSITENLSTFSSHLTNIIEILGKITGESLVLLDELGSGTDPAEGMGLAVAILEELRCRGCLFVATTHYPEIKDYAQHTEGLINARMAFDRETLSPMFKLQIGEAGESCALYIAQRLGLPAHMLNRAQKEAYGKRAAGQPVLPAEEFVQVQPAKKAAPANRIQKEQQEKAVSTRSESFNLGDSVTVYPQKSIGIVCKRTNEKGELGVIVKGEKKLVNHKRLKIHTPAAELYPDDYDFSVIFDTVANRKARHKMEKRHRPDLEVKYEDEL